jgi:hypothetical protein
MGILGKVFRKKAKPPQGNDEKATSSERTALVTCMACYKRTPVPISDPGFGTPIRCVHCQRPLIRPSEPEEGAPLSTSPELLNRTYGYSARYLDHPRCAWCKRLNYSIVFPEKGRLIGFSCNGRVYALQQRLLCGMGRESSLANHVRYTKDSERNQEQGIGKPGQSVVHLGRSFDLAGLGGQPARCRRAPSLSRGRGVWT